MKSVAVGAQIRAKEVRVINAKGAQLGVMSLTDALDEAKSVGLELVEISPNAKPPVCRIIDYGKFKYQQEKMAKDAKKKQKIIVVKEVRLRPRIEDNDFYVKIKNIIRFLEHGDRVKVSVIFRGRELGYQSIGRQLLEKVVKEVENFGVPDRLPSMEGRMLVTFFVPHKNDKKDKKGNV
ncbi:translation initiation factor IF-3 [PVC group bacterium (ex Bugula neritina AB1)]|nr:translation initiation factor IF-3 [PVC group bacterium (ex Bugula neritina AB1)]